MKHYFLLSTLLLSILACSSQIKEQKHVFYLHGRIVELQGINAYSERYGHYEYTKIIKALKAEEWIVYNEVRTATTDFDSFCTKVSLQIDSLINKGIAPSDITVIGGSKGAIMAMNISNRNPSPINYVLLGGNNEQVETENDWNLNGRILGIYEKTDQIANKSYQYWIQQSTNAKIFKEIEINTGLGHGFLYRPLNNWFLPAKEWVNSK